MNWRPRVDLSRALDRFPLCSLDGASALPPALLGRVVPVVASLDIPVVLVFGQFFSSGSFAGSYRDDGTLDGIAK